MADDHDTNSIQGGSESPEAKSLVVSSGFEFVLMGADGALDKAGISQIRAHTTRELHRSRRQNGQVRRLQRRMPPRGKTSGRPPGICPSSHADPDVLARLSRADGGIGQEISSLALSSTRFTTCLTCPWRMKGQVSWMRSNTMVTIPTHVPRRRMTLH